jgi:hypothetical protein
MSRLSSRAVARKFADALKAAEKSPVVIDHYGRPRAALVSLDHYLMFVGLMRRYAQDEAVAALAESFEATKEGRLGRASRLLHTSRRLTKAGGLAKRSPSLKETPAL